jgi:thiosulfate dehydrogenase [quinone] large subunit
VRVAGARFDNESKEYTLVIDVADHDARTVPRSSSHQPGHHTAVVVLLPLRIFLAAGWLRAAAEKLIEPQWWNGNKLRTFATAQHHDALPFFRPVLAQLVDHGAQAVAIVVVVTQLACGLAIAIGKPLRLALRWAVLLNVVFIMSGKVNPSAFYLVMEIVLLFAIADGTIGVRPTLPSRRTVLLAGVCAGLALAVAPYIRTIEPAEVIEDPAMMLVFLGLVTAFTLVVRRSAYRPAHVTYIRGLWSTWVAGWMHAKPNTVVRDEFERWYLLRGRWFAPPKRGTARALAPPSTDVR